jgi:hypothetical protein
MKSIIKNKSRNTIFSLLLISIAILTLFYCGNKTSDNESPESEKSQPIFYVKDETKYSKTFLEEFKQRHSLYQIVSVSLIDDTIIINDDKEDFIIIPTDLPLNQVVIYENTEKEKKQILTVKWINFSTLEYKYDEIINGQFVNQKQGTADLDPVFYYASDGCFEDENENIYGIIKYIKKKKKDGWIYIHIGVGSIEKSFLTCRDEIGKYKYSSHSLTRKI